MADWREKIRENELKGRLRAKEIKKKFRKDWMNFVVNGIRNDGIITGRERLK
jgi:hypothetical protein